METESKVRLATGLALWFVSGLLGLSLYLNFAGPNWYAWFVAGLLCVGLEASKVLLWRKGGGAKLIAVVLSALTVLAVLGSTLASIEQRRFGSTQAQITALQSTRAYQDLVGQVRGLEAEEKVLVGRLESLPPIFVSASTKLTSSLESLRRDRSALFSQLGDMERSVSQQGGGEAPALFISLAKLFGQDEDLVELTILLVLAVLIELSAFSLVGHGNFSINRKNPDEEKNFGTDIGTVGTPETPSAPKFGLVDLTQRLTPTPVDYLRLALDHRASPRLLGRSIVAKGLGVTHREARRLLARLEADGRIRRESRFWVAVGQAN